MGKMKEVFLQDRQKQQNLIESYYQELYMVGYTVGVAREELKEIINLTLNKNGTRNKERNA
tara:strand:- start:1317 stop:1499 length:183 start_codon:yes stop_codon:yes gene_type:complete